MLPTLRAKEMGIFSRKVNSFLRKAIGSKSQPRPKRRTTATTAN
jgi:hypothetical protein